ncbi:hypothetical protein Salat_2147100 [Sesamum alatum]|uniref:Uncharacterized protein n=1 Tax=Sesamum alatum TaxID=300844 RepID=A0AAE1Y2C9_9LAMI|nr:hypothetical protein Salat_2147100 [Sesamum alatum]
MASSQFQKPFLKCLDLTPNVGQSKPILPEESLPDLRNLVVDREGVIHFPFNGPALVDDTLEELKSCSHEFLNDSFDPAHIRIRNKEFGVYVGIVKVVVDRLPRENDRRH